MDKSTAPSWRTAPVAPPALLPERRLPPARVVRLARSSVRTLALRMLVLSALAVLLVCCQPGYPLAPTPCDDWCLATQRAGCEEDYPESCVSSCEDDFRIVRARCDAEWLALSDCYLRAPDDAFYCVEEESRPGPICVRERVDLAACGSAEAGSCMASCLREAQECGRPRRNCEGECRFIIPGCSEPARELYECRLASPVDCVRPGAPDPRPPEEIPCFAEALRLLDCADRPRAGLQR